MARFVTKISQILDRIAGWALVATMVLVVGNIILRLFKRPIEGTYEWVGFLTTLVIGLAVAYCAVSNGHIAITFLTERLSPRVQAGIDLAVGLVSLGFLLLVSWQLTGYAASMIQSGEVAPTTNVPFYPFIYLAAFGFLVYCLVILVDLGEAARKVVRK
ncbi:MAG: TRAP transporter small permease [Armatimonadetes bacterium]|nr:TRAP transporter small permease [Armatimonadota bacterium]